jgi:hypothetical protein
MLPNGPERAETQARILIQLFIRDPIVHFLQQNALKSWCLANWINPILLLQAGFRDGIGRAFKIYVGLVPERRTEYATNRRPFGVVREARTPW